MLSNSRCLWMTGSVDKMEEVPYYHLMLVAFVLKCVPVLLQEWGLLPEPASVLLSNAQK